MSEWRHASNGFVPSDGVAGGLDINGETIYVGRTTEGGDLVPGKIVPSHKVLYVPYDGKERAHSHYEYLVTPNYGALRWIASSGGQWPSNAVLAGKCAKSGEPLFVGRAQFQGSLVIGKVHPSHRVLYIPFDGREVAISDYEILVIKY